jgi:hypothetical protein
MRFLALIAVLGGCDGGGASDVGDTTPEDTDATDTDGDTDTEPADEPQFSIVGEYTLGHGELLPEDAAVYPTLADWVRSLSAEDFPEYTACMGEVVNADQGFVFEADGALVRRFDLEARTCSGDGYTEQHTIYVEYGSWAFAGNAEPVTDGDLYTVNGSRTWRIFPLSSYFRAYEGAAFFSLAPVE